jgi:hypothetical protein
VLEFVDVYDEGWFVVGLFYGGELEVGKEEVVEDATVSAEVDGAGVEFVTSRSQIQDFLKVAGTENVVMGVGTRIGAVYLKPQGDDSFVNTLALVSVQENNGGK